MWYNVGEPDETTGLYDRVVVTPDLEHVANKAVTSEVPLEEKLLQVMYIELAHFDDPEQVKYEMENFDMMYKDPFTYKFVYEEMLNEAIRVGIEYRNEVGKTVTESSFTPVTAVQETDIGSKVKLDKENKKTQKELR